MAQDYYNRDYRNVISKILIYFINKLKINY